MFRSVLTKISLASLSLILSTSSCVLAGDTGDDDEDSRKHPSSSSSVPAHSFASSSSRGGAAENREEVESMACFAGAAGGDSSSDGEDSEGKKLIVRAGDPLTPKMILDTLSSKARLSMYVRAKKALAENDKTFSFEARGGDQILVFRPVQAAESFEDGTIVQLRLKKRPPVFLRASIK